MSELPADAVPFAIVLAICAPAIAFVVVARFATLALERVLFRRRSPCAPQAGPQEERACGAEPPRPGAEA